MLKQIKITKIKSSIGCNKKQKKILLSLGLKKTWSYIYHNDNKSIRGMINKIFYMVKVENVIN